MTGEKRKIDVIGLSLVCFRWKWPYQIRKITHGFLFSRWQTLVACDVWLCVRNGKMAIALGRQYQSRTMKAFSRKPWNIHLAGIHTTLTEVLQMICFCSNSYKPTKCLACWIATLFTTSIGMIDCKFLHFHRLSHSCFLVKFDLSRDIFTSSASKPMSSFKCICRHF